MPSLWTEDRHGDRCSWRAYSVPGTVFHPCYFVCFFAAIPRNNCHYHVMDETSPESINKFPKCIQPVKNRVEICSRVYFVCVCVCVCVWDFKNNRIFPLQQNFQFIDYVFYLESRCKRCEPFFFLSHHVAFGTLVLWPGIKPGPQQWKCQFFTTGVPGNSQELLFVNSAANSP